MSSCYGLLHDRAILATQATRLDQWKTLLWILTQSKDLIIDRTVSHIKWIASLAVKWSLMEMLFFGKSRVEVNKWAKKELEFLFFTLSTIWKTSIFPIHRSLTGESDSTSVGVWEEESVLFARTQERDTDIKTQTQRQTSIISHCTWDPNRQKISISNKESVWAQHDIWK